VTAQQIIDTAKSRWGITDTSLDLTMLGWLNRTVWPKVRNMAIRVNKKYFNTVEYVNLTVDTPTYAPTTRIRELHAVHVLRDASSTAYTPLSHTELERNESMQVSSATSAGVYGYLMEGAKIRLRDIPKDAITSGLRLDYTPAMTVFALSDTIPLADDFADVLVDGECMCLAERKKDPDIIAHFTRQFAISMNEFRAAVSMRVDEPTNLESGVPETD